MLIPGTPAWDLFCEAQAREQRETALSPDLAPVVARIAAELAEGLSRIVPPDFKVYALRGFIWIGGPKSRFGASGAGFDVTVGANVNAGFTLDESLLIASESVLSRVQDGVTEELCVPWPSDPAGGRFAFAVACAEITGGVLRVWFASSDGVPVTEVVSVAVVSPDGC